MENALNFFIYAGAISLIIWLLWNFLEVAYRVVMIVLFAAAYAIITVYEWLAFIVRWIIIMPIIWAFRPITHRIRGGR
jgi:hypothetical protein